MIHQLQFGSNSTDGPVLVPVESLIAGEAGDKRLLEPIQLDLMFSTGSEFSRSEEGAPIVDQPELEVATVTMSDTTTDHVESQDESIVAVLSPELVAAEPVADWMLQSLNWIRLGQLIMSWELHRGGDRLRRWS
jgi:hypothetical protein